MARDTLASNNRKQSPEPWATVRLPALRRGPGTLQLAALPNTKPRSTSTTGSAVSRATSTTMPSAGVAPV